VYHRDNIYHTSNSSSTVQTAHLNQILGQLQHAVSNHQLFLLMRLLFHVHVQVYLNTTTSNAVTATSKPLRYTDVCCNCHSLPTNKCHTMALNNQQFHVNDVCTIFYAALQICIYFFVIPRMNFTENHNFQKNVDVTSNYCQLCVLIMPMFWS